MNVQVTAMGPGWRIHAGLNSAGFVSVHELARWWAAENCAAHVVAYMEGKFAGATLSERHGDRLRCVCCALSRRRNHTHSEARLIG